MRTHTYNVCCQRGYIEYSPFIILLILLVVLISSVWHQRAEVYYKEAPKEVFATFCP